ncbi:MAG TPA: FAD-binding protein [Angustibacter sp.]|nr:FAD-binding protein [Angustibacter sp.]
MTGSERNWAGNVAYGPDAVQRPTSLDELADVVRRAPAVRVLGTRHSFSDIACTDGTLVSLEALPTSVTVDAATATARVTGSLRYGELVPHLADAGFALPNLGSLPHISVAGACATGTHGSGDANRCLAAAVRAVDVVTGDGELRTLHRGDRGFPGAVVSLGALGAVVALTLDLVPSYQVRQDVYEDVPLAADDLTAALGDAYSVSLFSDLRSQRFRAAWLKRRDAGDLAGADPTWRGGRLAAVQHHPVPGQPPEGTTRQGEPGPWHLRLPHFRLDVPPSTRGEELQSEFLVGREHAADAWRAVLSLADRLGPLVHIAEVRSVAADDLWLSMASGRDSVALHFTWVPDVPAVRAALAQLEAALAPFEPRPHWGKVFVTPLEQVRDRYPHLDDAAALARECDPSGRFANAFVRRALGLTG